jgi:flagellar biosynthesis/type III secretory pathway protein FliH
MKCLREQRPIPRPGELLKNVRLVPAPKPPPAADELTPKYTQDDLTAAERRGWERGLREAREEARREARRELSAAVELCRNAAAVFSAEREKLRPAAERMGVELALAVADKLALFGAKQGADVKRIVEQALRATQTALVTRIRLHPEDLKIIAGVRDELHGAGEPLPAEAVLEADVGLARGGCVVEGACGGVDARLQTRLDLLAQALRESLVESPESIPVEGKTENSVASADLAAPVSPASNATPKLIRPMRTSAPETAAKAEDKTRRADAVRKHLLEMGGSASGKDDTA